MQQYELNGNRLLLVPIPEGANCFQSKWTRILMYYTVPGKKADSAQAAAAIPEGFELLTTIEAITGKQAAELLPVEHWGYGVLSYKDYTNPSQHFTLFKPLDSFQSWLTANGIFSNHAILIAQ